MFFRCNPPFHHAKHATVMDCGVATFILAVCEVPDAKAGRRLAFGVGLRGSHSCEVVHTALLGSLAKTKRTYHDFPAPKPVPANLRPACLMLA